MFYGCDNDNNMARIGYMNAVLHGIKNPNFTMDSLLENENAKDYIGKFDLVLANPPFSGSLVETVRFFQFQKQRRPNYYSLL